MKKKLLSILLCLCMVVTLLPTVALATDWGGVAGGGIGFNYGDNGFINIIMPTSNGRYTYGTCTTTEGTTTADATADNRASLPASGWNWAVQYHTTPVNGANYTLTLKDFNLNYTGTDDGLMFHPSINLVLVGTNIISAPNSGTALSGFSPVNSLYISGQGNLTVTGKTYGILGLCTISGGTVTATGGDAGIASTGADGITISGGTVTAEATGNNGAAFNKAPTLTGYTNYQWNTNESSPAWNTTAFTNEGAPAYVAIKPATPVMSVDFDGEGGNDPTLYADFETGWNAAVAASTATVTLLANWTATGNGTNNSFGTGNGFGNGTTETSGCVCVPNGKIITLDLNGHDIDRALTSPVGTDANTAGWVIGDYGTLTITDSSTTNVAAQGKITGGYNSFGTFSAGGIFVAQGVKSLTINGGNITGNKALNWGGGVYALSRSTVTMTGGKISGNYANYDDSDGGGAGGVFTNGTLIMTGGEISENYACGSGSVGGGVYLYASGSMTVGETAVVRDNKAGATFDSGTATGGNANNVYLDGSKIIACGTGTAEKPVLDDGAYIGVTTETQPTDGNPVTITGNNSRNFSVYFHSDNPSYAMQNTGEGLGQEVELALRSTTPTATTTTVAKTAATQASVDFTLTNTPAYADSQTWKVYSGSTGDTQASGVTVSNVGNTLTLAHASDIPAETYYVAVTETGKAESARLTLAVSAYVAPSSSGSSSPTYSITNGTTSTANGSVTLDKTNATSGSTVKITPKAKDGYEVDTITVKDANGKTIDVTKNADGTFSFKMPSGKVTVEATFKKIVTETPWVNPFGDVSETDWFYDAVEYANENGLFAGTGTNTFSPSAPMTRAMLWTVLGRLDGQTMTGSDVFDAAKDWATEKGITDGSNPNGEITREQLVTILWRYAGSPAPTGNLDGFSDADSVADYAKLAMAWAVENGIVSGSNGALMPTNPATRGQVAAIVMRYAQSAEK